LTLSLDLASIQAVGPFAARFAAGLCPPLVIGLSGDIGTGKTTLIRAILQHLGVHSPIKSPSFSLLESYELAKLTIHHFDLYRVQHADELDYIGFRDYFSVDNICFIEWVERLGHASIEVDLSMLLTMQGEGRQLLIKGLSELGEKIIRKLKEKSDE
jgi:tRNA threonylcarbamoyladenosine biosynthesis protein TsaE